MKMQIKLYLAIILSAAMLFTPGCFNKSVDKAPPIRVALSEKLNSFDPVQTVDVYSEAVLRCVYTTLFDFDDKLQLQNKLAKQVVQTADRVWTITIHPGVKFHDGSYLTADDVAFTLNRAKTADRTAKSLESVESITATDETTIVITLKQPFSQFLGVLAKANLSILSKKVVSDPAYDFSQPIGAGPYRLVEPIDEKSIKLACNKDYFLTPAKADIEFLVLQSDQDRTSAILNNEIDIIFSISPFDREKLSIAEGITIFKQPSTKVEMLTLSMNKAPFTDKRVRQAIHCAINKEHLVKTAYLGYSNPITSVVAPSIMGYYEYEDFQYNPERAKKLLAEAGYPNGFAMTLDSNGVLRKNLLEHIKLDLAAVGIAMRYNLLDSVNLRKKLVDGDYETSLISWTSNPDPDSTFPILFGTNAPNLTNRSGYSNPIIEALFAQGRLENDPIKRAQLYQEANRIIIADFPVIMLHNPMSLVAAKQNIGGVAVNPQGLHCFEQLYRQTTPNN